MPTSPVDLRSCFRGSKAVLESSVTSASRQARCQNSNRLLNNYTGRTWIRSIPRSVQPGHVNWTSLRLYKAPVSPFYLNWAVHSHNGHHRAPKTGLHFPPPLPTGQPHYNPAKHSGQRDCRRRLSHLHRQHLGRTSRLSPLRAPHNPTRPPARCPRRLRRQHARSRRTGRRRSPELRRAPTLQARRRLPRRSVRHRRHGRRQPQHLQRVYNILDPRLRTPSNRQTRQQRLDLEIRLRGPAARLPVHAPRHRRHHRRNPPQDLRAQRVRVPVRARMAPGNATRSGRAERAAVPHRLQPAWSLSEPGRAERGAGGADRGGREEGHGTRVCGRVTAEWGAEGDGAGPEGVEVVPFVVAPEDLGLQRHPLVEVAGGKSPVQNAGILQTLLEGGLEEGDPILDFVLMNTAALLVLSGICDADESAMGEGDDGKVITERGPGGMRWKEGVRRARWCIKSGGAMREWQNFIRITNEIGEKEA
ncbi:anthranilate phosphoribosyltransferase [Zalaria obscura]|uniref:Anthranilate phosphoribosyltransferase n=1 Tax=Zalaria obscura TaxID=2024903 RepID=A0ACC3S4P9_9PEZI